MSTFTPAFTDSGGTAPSQPIPQPPGPPPSPPAVALPTPGAPIIPLPTTGSVRTAPRRAGGPGGSLVLTGAETIMYYSPSGVGAARRDADPIFSTGPERGGTSPASGGGGGAPPPGFIRHVPAPRRELLVPGGGAGRVIGPEASGSVKTTRTAGGQLAVVPDEGTSDEHAATPARGLLILAALLALLG